MNTDEQYFVVRPGAKQLSFVGWTDLEVEVVAEHKRWSVAKIANAVETVWPANLAKMLGGLMTEIG